ncbi:MAG: hypothetical protein BWY27_01465 [Bacteroidetes bacterium ADurb.Bin234]|nr:MAG: hypothetical protein BWY27_01465 [Bacteroidetes bacterium ADurb.Bin234]
MDESKLITYKEMLAAIDGQENNLLIANGFNYGLGVHTGYSDIFKKMLKSNYGIYAEATSIIEACNYDLELFLNKITEDIADSNSFLKKYVCNKIKLDFMQALHDIVKSKIKNIYEEKNEGIYILLKQFTNYFTLNYDSFLYMLLLKYKSVGNENNAISFEPTIKFIGSDLDDRQNAIYSEIKKARETGGLEITIEDNSSTKKAMCLLPKTQFISIIKTYCKDKGKDWDSKSIEKVVNKILEDEKRNQILNHVDDGSKKLSLFEDDFVFETNSITQNLFFLHGAFHIYKDGKKIKKITQDKDKALYEKLEELLNTEEKEIVCIFQSTNKMEVIQQNEYLVHCYEKLETLSGNMVIIGSSLAENDNHIFEKINSSKIDTIYITAMKKEIEKNYSIAKGLFPDKNIFMINTDSISYEMPQ